MGRLRILLGFIKRNYTILKKGRLEYVKSQGMRCGKGCVVSSGTDFGSEPFLITLHDNVRISGGVSFITHDGAVHTIKSSKKYDENMIVHKFGKIEVGDNTFIGANSIILPNVYIGKNCIVAAGAVVTHSFPDDCVVAGIPAKCIGNTWEYAEKVIGNMPSDWNQEEYLNKRKEYLQSVIKDPQI